MMPSQHRQTERQEQPSVSSDVRSPGEPLTASQIQDVRNAQRTMQEGRAYSFQERESAEYASMCGKLDPVTKEQALR